MDPIDPYRVMEPGALQLPLEPVRSVTDLSTPFKPSSNQILPTEIHETPVDSLLVNKAYFSEIKWLKRISSGATGVVYEAIHQPSGRRHALKVISRRHREGWARYHILPKAEPLGDGDNIRHPNVVRCHGIHYSNKQIQVLSDYVDGGTLKGFHEQDNQFLSTLTFQILRGLAYLHERKVVHRAIKPSNLLVDFEGNIKIGDWVGRDLAKTMDPRDASVGTIAYTSPERIETSMKGGDCDGYAGDIWSVGVCVLEIYQGQFPYGCEMEHAQLILKIAESEPPQAPPTASVGFRDFIDCCLQKDPSKRWTAAQLLRHPFISLHNRQNRVSTEMTGPSNTLAAYLQNRVSTEMTGPPIALAAADITKLDLNPSPGRLHTPLSGGNSHGVRLEGLLLQARHRWLKPGEILQVLQNHEKYLLTPEPPHRPLKFPSASREILNFIDPTFQWRSKKEEEKKTHRDLMQTESSKGFGNGIKEHCELATLEVPTSGDQQGWAEEFHRDADSKMKLKSVMSDQDQGEDICMLSEDENPRAVWYQEDKLEVMQMESTGISEDKQNPVEMRPNSSIGMDQIETDSCCIDSDAENAMEIQAGGKHQKFTASGKCHQTQILEIQLQSNPGAPLAEWCLPVEMSVDANIEDMVTEPSSQSAQIDDALSWELFYQNVGDIVDSMDIQAIAKEIVRACGRDSRSLTIMARALSNVSDIETWEYAVDSLSLQHPSCLDDSENLTVNVWKFSIELLEDDVTINCLKNFALHSNSKEVARASLIDGWIREGMLTTHSEGEKVINNLLDAKLLELSENGGHVKLLDLGQRLVDPIFQPGEGCEFLMQGGLGLVEPPEVGEWERAKEICLMNNDLNELPEDPRCPSLSTLFLQRNHKLKMIPSSFFSHMPALEVLNLSRTRIKSLPDSLFQLVSLRRLFLNECILFRTLSAKVSGLRNLEVLDLEGTKLMGLPKEIEQLINLTCLEVSILGSTSLRLSKEAYPLIPSGVVSSLLHLKELNIDVDPDAEWWDSCAEGLVGEICSLEKLNTLKFYFPKVELLRQFDATTLSHFRLIVGKHIGRIMSRIPLDIEFELERWHKYLKYILGEGVPEDVKKVLRQADAFFLDRHAKVEKLSYFGTENMEQLK
ncbi:hypothetical protein CDL15_Pgr027642 [Punica granatum]|uniref:Protein kinase domain-containing protein n=1 Tax=Punica granatum TaxID=22663 RepID=A0A218XI15_PUNGR|nr:hypothetical protein CDL15_Pgr027642 [Punica granatum]